MSFSKSQLIIIGSVLVIVLFFILIFLGVIPGLRSDLGSKTKLVMWGVYDSADDFAGSFSRLATVLPNVSISYVQKDPLTYETELVNALALGSAPDIVMVHNSWLHKHSNKLSPAPATTFDLKAVRDLFPAVVEQDFVSGGNVYALPLYIDTLALYYNQDLFNAANLSFPPSTWDEFIADVDILKNVDRAGKINRAAAAIGGSADSVNHAPDLIYLLMLQSGARMVDANYTAAVFADYSKDGIRPGSSALEFYTQFGNSRSPHYTWNDSLHYSLDSFSEGAVAMIFDYSFIRETITSKNPFLKFSIAKIPQLSDAPIPVNFADYWGLSVLNRSPYRALAWQAVAFLTTDLDSVNGYLSASSRPPALRSLLSACSRDTNLSPFCAQTLTARTWPRPDQSKVDDIFSNAVKSVLNGKLSILNALSEAQDNVSLLLTKNK